MLTNYQPKEITPVLDLRALINEWQENLSLRVDAQELSADTAIGYGRGAMKFITG
jgi:hypothetical protein